MYLLSRVTHSNSRSIADDVRSYDTQVRLMLKMAGGKQDIVSDVFRSQCGNIAIMHQPLPTT